MIWSLQRFIVNAVIAANASMARGKQLPEVILAFFSQEVYSCSVKIRHSVTKPVYSIRLSGRKDSWYINNTAQCLCQFLMNRIHYSLESRPRRLVKESTLNIFSFVRSKYLSEKNINFP